MGAESNRLGYRKRAKRLGTVGQESISADRLRYPDCMEADPSQVGGALLTAGESLPAILEDVAPHAMTIRTGLEVNRA